LKFKEFENKVLNLFSTISLALTYIDNCYNNVITIKARLKRGFVACSIEDVKLEFLSVRKIRHSSIHLGADRASTM